MYNKGVENGIVLDDRNAACMCMFLLRSLEGSSALNKPSECADPNYLRYANTIREMMACSEINVLRTTTNMSGSVHLMCREAMGKVVAESDCTLQISKQWTISVIQHIGTRKRASHN